MPIRQARVDDLPVLQTIEVAAGKRFDEISMPEIAGDQPLPRRELEECQRSGLAWVATDANDTPVGYLIAKEVDDNLHIEQISVLLTHARRGIGRHLIEQAEREAISRELAAVTLTTFRDVPWNAPYYARCGFRNIAPDDHSPGLRRIRQDEASHGLDRWPRVTMRKTAHR